ncbi:MAG: hypothetical protein WAT39_02535 [Planctomycetota bacterium]
MNPISRLLVAAAACAAIVSAQAPAGTDQSPPTPISWKDLTRSGLPIKFYGFLRLDTYYNTARMDSVVLPSRVLPEADPTLTPGAGQAKRDDDQFFLDPRLTRFGIDVNGGEIAGAKVLGKLEIDFANFPDGSSESRATPRIRVAWIDIFKDTLGLRVGQDWDVIAPLFPAANHELLMWNAGNLGDRRAQIQGRWVPNADFELKAALGLTGAISNQDLDGGAEANTALPTTGERDGFDSGTPHLQVRGGSKPFALVDKKPAELGVWGMYGQVQTDTNFAGRGRRFDTWVAGFDLQMPLTEALTLRGEGFVGENLGDVRGGIGQTINTALGAEIGSTGGWAELVYGYTAKTKFHVGTSIDDPENDDLTVPSIGTNGGNNGNGNIRKRNQTAYVGTVMDWETGVRTGFDVIYWQTDYAGLNGTNGQTGDAYRFNLYFQFNF